VKRTDRAEASGQRTTGSDVPAVVDVLARMLLAAYERSLLDGDDGTIAAASEPETPSVTVEMRRPDEETSPHADGGRRTDSSRATRRGGRDARRDDTATD
jgi:hypothetical protein